MNPDTAGTATDENTATLIPGRPKKNTGIDQKGRIQR